MEIKTSDMPLNTKGLIDNSYSEDVSCFVNQDLSGSDVKISETAKQLVPNSDTYCHLPKGLLPTEYSVNTDGVLKHAPISADSLGGYVPTGHDVETSKPDGTSGKVYNLAEGSLTDPAKLSAEKLIKLRERLVKA